MRITLLLATLTLLAAACSSSDSEADPIQGATTAPPAPTSSTSAPTTSSTTTPATATTTTPAPPTTGVESADAALIEHLWADYSASWLEGVAAAYGFMAEHTHPIFECTTEDFAQFYDVPEGYRQEVTVDTSLMVRDDDWAIPSGTGQGTVLDGRLYVFPATFTNQEPGSSPETFEVAMRTVISDGRALSLMFCRR